jgi:SAM-dependent methyltransferase
MAAKYPPGAYSGARARLPGWFIGVPYARYLDRAVRLLDLGDGGSVCDVACGPGYNLPRLVRAVGPGGQVTAIEDDPHLLSQARQKAGRAGWGNVTLLASLDPGQIPRAPVDGIIIGDNPPIFWQRPDLLEAAWAILRPGGRLCAVGARCTTLAGWLAGPLVRLGLTLVGHPGDWHYRTVHEPWRHLEQISAGKTMVEPKLGFEYILWAQKSQQVSGPAGRLAGPALSAPEAPLCVAPATGKRTFNSRAGGSGVSSGGAELSRCPFDGFVRGEHGEF